jgi:hypothetical protein
MSEVICCMLSRYIESGCLNLYAVCMLYAVCCMLYAVCCMLSLDVLSYMQATVVSKDRKFLLKLFN